VKGLLPLPFHFLAHTEGNEQKRNERERGRRKKEGGRQRLERKSEGR
jgi:hypothetical protein